VVVARSAHHDRERSVGQPDLQWLLRRYGVGHTLGGVADPFDHRHFAHAVCHWWKPSRVRG
jgi:hypothetical protein